MSARIGCLGVHVALTSGDPISREVLEELRADFAAFPALSTEDTRAGPPAARILLSCGPAEAVPALPFAFRTRMCEVRGWGAVRVCRYGDFAECVDRAGSEGSREISIRSRDPGLLREIAYGALMSTLGEGLDRRGWHRIHALGFSYRGHPVVLTLPQGGGKSALAAQVLEAGDDFKLFSDEMPLLRGGEIQPFPVRLAFRPALASRLGLEGGRKFARLVFAEKLLFPVPTAKVARGGRLALAMRGIPVEGVSRICPESWFISSSRLTSALVVGSGLPQMAEHMLRGSAMPALASIAASRALTALRAARQAELLRFEVGRDPTEAFSVLRAFLEARFGLVPEREASLNSDR